MKKMYWHAHNLPRIYIVTICIIALIGMAIVETHKRIVPQKYYKEKVAAAKLAAEAFHHVRSMRQRLSIAVNLGDDPQQSGLIGKQLTNITTDQGVLSAKQTSINPNIAAIFVDWLKQLNLKKRDVVAVGTTGSFPALNICMLAAIKTLGLRPLIIYSAGASQYGANVPGFTWLDIQNQLESAHIFNFKPLAVSLGGARDIAYGMTPQGKEILLNTIEKYKLTYLGPRGTIDSSNKRMEIYKRAAGDKPIKAYINIGGGMASIGLKAVPGSAEIKHVSYLAPHGLHTGVVKSLPIGLVNVDSVAVRFLREGVPVINIRHVAQKLREQYHLPRNPKVTPAIGVGAIFALESYNQWLASIILGVIVLVLIILAIVSRKYRIRYIRSPH
ncbi:MAG: hypothetical protein A3F10_02940 [Coxiella sp. RIFCSPHIGHO2_12_FULL_42_15]|nr:MAG: hypothetical protein A3F10_02940 [Coxiella sp. RIFCSPHIGHO2_12_FULL_42_15]